MTPGGTPAVSGMAQVLSDLSLALLRWGPLHVQEALTAIKEHRVRCLRFLCRQS